MWATANRHQMRREGELKSSFAMERKIIFLAYTVSSQEYWAQHTHHIYPVTKVPPVVHLYSRTHSFLGHTGNWRHLKGHPKWKLSKPRLARWQLLWETQVWIKTYVVVKIFPWAQTILGMQVCNHMHDTSHPHSVWQTSHTITCSQQHACVPLLNTLTYSNWFTHQHKSPVPDRFPHRLSNKHPCTSLNN